MLLTATAGSQQESWTRVARDKSRRGGRAGRFHQFLVRPRRRFPCDW